jgi:hypothetical protein
MTRLPAHSATRAIARTSLGVLLATVLAAQTSTAAASEPVHNTVDAATPAALSGLPYGPDTCKNGFVWREARPSDHVCVTPATRQTTWDENALADSRREPNGGPYGPNTCKQGFVWREAFDGDVVCVTPDRRTQAKADNAAAAERRQLSGTTDALSPGQHTVVLKVERSRAQKSIKAYDCHLNDQETMSGFPVGWDQFELDGGAPCGAEMAEVAVHFDEGPLNQVPVKVIDRAILTYDEAPAAGCFFILWPTGGGLYHGIIPRSTPGGSTCWKSGSGAPEPKPNGCVAVLGFPTVDWINTNPSGPLPHTTYAQVRRTTPREWDVSAPYFWQYAHTAPLGGSPPPRFGFLLRGSITSFANLTGEDRTSCGSVLSNLQLRVTYTVPPDGGPFIPPR